MNDEATRDAIWEKVRAIETCMMVTRDGPHLRSRPMAAILRTGQNAIWFFADATNHKDDELAQHPQACLAFADPAFAVHGPVPAPFGDEGAANHMRLCAGHDTPGVEIFVYGVGGGRFPARQHLDASKAIARRHRLVGVEIAE